MKEGLNRFGAIILISLLLVKISAFHVYEHHDTLDDSDNHCELCVMTVQGHHFDGVIPSSLAIACTPPIALVQTNIVSFEQDFISSVQEGIRFSRPPPYTLI